MSGPVFSPDGKWMWTGSEWIPSPPGMNTEVGMNAISDSVVMGNVSINDSASISSAVQNASQCNSCGSNNVSIITCSTCNVQAYCSVCKDENLQKKLDLASSESHTYSYLDFKKLCEKRLCNSCFNQEVANSWDSCQYCALVAGPKKNHSPELIKLGIGAKGNCSVCGSASCVRCGNIQDTQFGFSINLHLVEILNISTSGQICKTCFTSIGPHPLMMCNQCNKMQQPNEIMFGEICGSCHVDKIM